MAEIPVKKKSSSWIWILLALVLVALLIWWLLAEAGEGDEVAAVDDIESAETAGMETEAAGAITTVTALSDLPDMIGREVRLEDVAVTEVIGDMHFTVGEENNEAMIRFDQVPTPDTEREGLIDVNPGSRVTIEGTVMDLDTEMPDTVSREISDDTQAYIMADLVSVIDGGTNQ